MYLSRLIMKGASLLISVFIFILTFPLYSQNSPYKLNLTTDGILTVTGTLSAGVAYSLDNGVKPITQDEISELDRNSINRFDRSATNFYNTKVSNLSNGLAVTGAMLPALFLADKRMRNDWFTIGVMYYETLIFSTFTPDYAKWGFKRIRPFVYNQIAPISEKTSPDARKSFFSGHTSVAFSTAVFLSKVYCDYYPDSDYNKYVLGCSLILASSVGVCRYYSGEHFPTDIITGAFVGSAIGYLIPYLHKEGMEKIGIYPSGSKDYLGLNLIVKF